MAGIARLSAADVMNLAVEAPDTPMHQAVLAAVEAEPLLGPDGHVDIDKLRRHVAARLDRTPELRQVAYRPGLFRGRALLVDDASFRIENHVLFETLPAPGGERAAIAFAEREMGRRFDRARPLWAMWVLDGYAPNRLGLLIKLHHAIADGPAMVNMLAQIFDLEPLPADTPSGAWAPAPRPAGRRLFADNVSAKLQLLAAIARVLRHPLRRLRGFIVTVRAMLEELRQAGGGPHVSINRPVRAERRITALHVSLPAAKSAAHRLGVRLNDVFLFIVARSLREMLVHRGEKVSGVCLHVSVAMSQQSVRDAEASGNHAGTVIVPVPLGPADPREQLAAIAAASKQAKTRQLPTVSMGLMAVLAETGVARAFTRRQHMVNVLTTNLPGPPLPFYLAGARVFSPVALPPIAGNVTLSFAALSYERELALSVVADASAWPDFADLEAAMSASLRDLERMGTDGTTSVPDVPARISDALASEPIAAGRPV